MDQSGLECIAQLEEQFDFKNKSTQQIIWILDDNLYERQKKTIYQLTSMDEEVNKILKQLDHLDKTYQEFQGFIEAHTEHIETLTRETQTIEAYHQVLQRRTKNQMNLYETLSIMLQGVELSSEEKQALNNPNFDAEDGVTKCEAILEKISKFLRFQSDKASVIRAVKEQLAKIQDNLNTFSSKFKDYLKKQSRVVLSQSLQNDESDDEGSSVKLQLADTSGYRRLLMSQRRIVSYLLECTEDRGLIEEIGANLQWFIGTSTSKIEQMWNQNIATYPLYQLKINLVNAYEKVNISPEDNQFLVMVSEIKKFNYIHVVTKLLTTTLSQLQTDEKFWDKFFNFNKEEDEQSILQRNAQVQSILRKAYSTLLKKQSDLLLSSTSTSPLITYMLENVVQDLDKENATSAFKDLLFTLRAQVDTQRKDIVKQVESYLKGLDVNTRHCGVLPPIKNLVICIRLLTISLSDQSSFYRDINVIFMKTFEWLKAQAAKKQKYSDIVLVVNLGHIIYNLDCVQALPIKELVTKCGSSYRKTSKDYSSYLFCYQFMKFCDQWFKFKELKPNELESQNFNKGSFLKLINSTFANFPKSMDAIQKRMHKHLAKDEQCVKRQLKMFMDYLSEEYGEIETFCQRALGQKPTTSKQSLVAVVQQRL